MAYRRKRACKERYLSALDDHKKSKFSDSSFSTFSASCGVLGPDEDHLRKIDHETVNDGDNGRMSSSFIGGKTSDGDKSSVFEKDPGKSKESLEDTDSLTEQNCTPSQSGFQKTVKVENSDSEEQPESIIISQNLKPYACFCGKRYGRSYHLHRHQMTHVKIEETSDGETSEKPFSCVCGKRYAGNSQLVRHQKTCLTLNEESQVKTYICSCGKRYSTIHHLYRHHKSHIDHEEDEDSARMHMHICDCGKTFNCKSSLLRHQKTHTQEQNPVKEDEDEEEDTKTYIKPYVCKCGKSYTCSSHLYRHQRTHEDGDIPIKIKSRAEQSKMEKPYKCECGKSYTSSSHLYRHQRTHEVEEVLVDDVDDVDYEQEDVPVDEVDCEQEEVPVDDVDCEQEEVLVDDVDCDSDIQYEEPEDKPYQCECGKSFILWFSLMVHKRVHCKVKFQSSAATNSGSPPFDI